VPLTIAQQNSDIPATIKSALENAIEGAQVKATGGQGHFQIEIVAAAFEGKSMLESHRLVLGAIAHLMSGPDAPVHAVDSIKTSTP
jgi:acid stress-induced BolA-like protein IbaG/YrbA